MLCIGIIGKNMQLIAFMKDRALSDADFAALYNDGLPEVRQVGRSAVKKWKYRERTPDADSIVRIETITNGLVALRDWASPEPRRATGARVSERTATRVSSRVARARAPSPCKA